MTPLYNALLCLIFYRFPPVGQHCQVQATIIFFPPEEVLFAPFDFGRSVFLYTHSLGTFFALWSTSSSACQGESPGLFPLLSNSFLPADTRPLSFSFDAPLLSGRLPFFVQGTVFLEPLNPFPP